VLGALAGSAHVNLSVNRGTFSRDMLAQSATASADAGT